MIRIAEEKDLRDILEIHRLAFNEEDEAELVENLLNDPSAHPCLSLLSFKNEESIGHILLTKAQIVGTPLNAYLLAPLAVKPDYHYKGTGKRLMREAFKQLKQMDVDIVFVLGDPAYYTQVGFQTNAGKLGYPTPVPIPAKWADAWMMMKLHDCNETGQVKVADQISAPEYWSD